MWQSSLVNSVLAITRKGARARAAEVLRRTAAWGICSTSCALSSYAVDVKCAALVEIEGRRSGGRSFLVQSFYCLYIDEEGGRKQR